MTSRMSLPIHTTTAGEFLKSLALYNNIKYIIAIVNGLMIISVGAD